MTSRSVATVSWWNGAAGGASLLPQVAVEWRWDAARFVAETCRKAGLPLDAWQRGACLWRFEAEVFAERGRNALTEQANP